MSEKTNAELVEDAKDETNAVRDFSHYELDVDSRLRLADLIEALAARLAAAEAIIAKMPKTADGVPIFPGMRIYYWHHGLNEVRSVTAKQMDQTWSAHKGDDVDSGWVRWALTDGYSTEAAALAPATEKGAG